MIIWRFLQILTSIFFLYNVTLKLEYIYLVYFAQMLTSIDLYNLHKSIFPLFLYIFSILRLFLQTWNDWHKKERKKLRENLIIWNASFNYFNYIYVVKYLFMYELHSYNFFNIYTHTFEFNVL